MRPDGLMGQNRYALINGLQGSGDTQVVLELHSHSLIGQGLEDGED